MSEPGGTVPEPGRCPTCGARVLASQDWCSLCLQPLGAGSTPVGDAAPGGAHGHDAGHHAGHDAGHDAGEDARQDTHPGTQPDAPPRPAAGALPPGTEAMFAELAASSAAERPLARGLLAGTSRGVRLALGCGAAVVLVGVLTLVLGLASLLL